MFSCMQWKLLGGIIDSHLHHKSYLDYSPRSDAYLRPCQTSVMEIFCKTSERIRSITES